MTKAPPLPSAGSMVAMRVSLGMFCALLCGCAWAAEDPYAATECRDSEEVRPYAVSIPAAPPVPVAQSGYATIVCAPRCVEIVADGTSLGASPLIEVPFAAGQHRLELRGPGGVTKTVVIVVEAGRITKKRVMLFRHHAGRKWRHHRRFRDAE